MKINTNFDSSQFMRVSKNSSTKQISQSSTIVGKSKIDTVDINFKDSMMKSPSTQSTSYTKLSNQSVSSQRIAELKSLYQGDNCPTSNADIANAILGSICGL